MALNELINQIVDVQVRNVTSNTYSRDLNTILVLSKHDVFSVQCKYNLRQCSSFQQRLESLVYCEHQLTA